MLFKGKWGLLWFLIVLGAIFTFTSDVGAAPLNCHVNEEADCDGWSVNVVGPGGEWTLKSTTGATSGTWTPGQKFAPYDVEYIYQKWISDGYWDHSGDELVCPTRVFSASRTTWGNEHSGQCHGSGLCEQWSKGIWFWKEWYHHHGTLETFGPIDVVYGTKSSDPNKCHKPTGHSLGVPSWAMSDFNKLPQHLPGNIDHSNDVWVDTSRYIEKKYNFSGNIPRPDCFEPPPPKEQTVYLDPSCKGVDAQDQESSWIGGEDGYWDVWVNVGNPYEVHTWTLPLIREKWTPPEWSEIVEPFDCFNQPKDKTQTVYESDCEGVEAQDQIDSWVGGFGGGWTGWTNKGDPYYVHLWTNPQQTETWGEHEEPGSCFEPPEPLTQTIYDSDCDGVYGQAQIKSWVGGENGDWGEWVNNGIRIYLHLWNDPYEIETWEDFVEKENCKEERTPTTASVSVSCEWGGHAGSTHTITGIGENVTITMTSSAGTTTGPLTLRKKVETISWKAEPAYGYKLQGPSSGEVTLVPCPSKGAFWKDKCKNNCGVERYETTSGPTTHLSKSEDGGGEEGVLVASVNDDCYVTPEGCKTLTYHYFISKVETTPFKVLDRSGTLVFEPSIITDGYGNKWRLLVGYSKTCIEEKEDCSKILPDLPIPEHFGGKAVHLSWDGWVVETGAVIYREGACNLAPGRWMTTINNEGEVVACKVPGVSGHDWQFTLFKWEELPWPPEHPLYPDKLLWDNSTGSAQAPTFNPEVHH